MPPPCFFSLSLFLIPLFRWLLPTQGLLLPHPLLPSLLSLSTTPPSLILLSLPLSVYVCLLLQLNGNTHRCVKGRSNSTHPTVAAAASPTHSLRTRGPSRGTNFYFGQLFRPQAEAMRSPNRWLEPTCLKPVLVCLDHPAGHRSSSIPAGGRRERGYRGVGGPAVSRFGWMDARFFFFFQLPLPSLAIQK